jgi:hypothetical protein
MPSVTKLMTPLEAWQITLLRRISVEAYRGIVSFHKIVFRPATFFISALQVIRMKDVQYRSNPLYLNFKERELLSPVH